ncbi:MAG: endonuclease/exonuclease/phosphatase family protein [Microbacteriaceae bacterium]
MVSRILAAAFVLGCAAFLLVCSWPQLFGLQQTAVFAQIVSLRGASIVAAFIGVVVSLLIALISSRARRFTASVALVLIGFMLLSAAVLATRGLGNTSFETRGTNDLVVMTWNTLGDAPGAEAIAALALERGADIVALPETTRETGIAVAQFMGAGGSPMWSHTVAYDQVSKARSTTVLISADLGTYEVAEERITSVLPTIIATPTDGTGPTIIAVHAVAPIPGQMQNWRSDLKVLAESCVGDNVIMAGDFNSTPDHFAGLGTTTDDVLGDCTSSAVVSKNGAVGTWPSRAPALLGAPIDHITHTTNWRTSGFQVIETHDAYGSDHRPVIAQLTPAG